MALTFDNYSELWDAICEAVKIYGGYEMPFIIEIVCPECKGTGNRHNGTCVSCMGTGWKEAHNIRVTKRGPGREGR